MVHLLFEILAYVVGFLLLRRERARGQDTLGRDARWTVTVAAFVGAALGSKLVHWLTEWPELSQLAEEQGVLVWLGGKSIVGGLIGGTLAVELVKARSGLRQRTGDVFVTPIVAAVVVGRIGCFLSGLADHTHGTPTSLPWGVDLGDGVHRHPVQLYEIGALLGIYAWIRTRRHTWPSGRSFDALLLGYLALRLGLDAWKPYARWWGLAGTQWSALAGIVWRLGFLYRRRMRASLAHEHAPS